MTARLLLGRQLAALDDVDWTVVTGDPYVDAPTGLTVELIPIRREFALSDPKSFARLLGLFRSEHFDFVQTHTPKPSFLGLPAARLSRTPAIYTIHGSLYFRGNGSLANVLGWCFERWCCTWATRVALQSREDESVLPKVGICPARKISYIGNGIDAEYFSSPVEPARLPEPDDAEVDGPRAAKTGGELPVVLMVSRLVREKGCQDFLQLAGELAGRARFVHVGPTESDQSDALTDGEISAARGTVTFVGDVADVRPYMAVADIVVLPSYREGIPRAVMEAAAAGRPIVAYDIRGVREVIEPDTGLLVPRGDVARLRDLVAELIDDPERRHSLGARCQRWVLDGFREDAVVDRLRTLYAALPPRKGKLDSSRGTGPEGTSAPRGTGPEGTSAPRGTPPSGVRP
jgi:glycosyltransferase involved in cell wall biosynthesis